MQEINKNIRFRVRNKGGVLGGKTLEHEVADFDWALFKNIPNAEAFVQKAYFAAAKKLVRELHERKNQTEEHHLKSMESLVARSIKFSREEIVEWCESRDWSRASFSVEPSKAIQLLKKHLPGLSSSDSAFPEHLRRRAGEIISDVADSKSDPTADYLFVKLSQEQQKQEMLYPL